MNVKNETQMTDQELIAAAREYDRGQNEGSKGYNPFTVEQDRRAAKIAAARPVTRDDLLRRLQSLDCSAAREAGTFDQDKISAIRQQLTAMDEADAIRPKGKWTVCDGKMVFVPTTK